MTQTIEHLKARVAELEADISEMRADHMTLVEENHALREQLLLAQAEIKRLRDGVTAVNDLINASSGVAGLHLNGDIATWEELRTGGRFEEWLCLFDEALAQPSDTSALDAYVAEKVKESNK